MSLSGFGVIRRSPANRPTLAAFLAWTVILCGWVAAVLFGAWVLASILDDQGLADAMFYAFVAALVASMGLREYRKSARRASLGP